MKKLSTNIHGMLNDKLKKRKSTLKTIIPRDFEQFNFQ
jgi:hypothetical protein